MPTEPDRGALSPSIANAFLHEARNAVFGLSVTLDAMEDETAPGASLAEHAPTLLACAGRTTRLMKELVAYLEPVAPERSHLDLRASVHAVIVDVAPVLGERCLRLELPESPLPVFFPGDARLVHRALCALVQGVDTLAGGHGDMVVAVSLRRELARGFIDVRIGVASAEVAPERLATFFEPFAVRSPRLTGFSLALAYRSLVEQNVHVVLTSPRVDAIEARASFPITDTL